MLAALASTALLTLYFGAILHSRRLGMSLGAGLLGLYSLYLILQAEDKALLLGSILLFIILAVLMLLTRHLDWYALTGSSTVGIRSERAASGQAEPINLGEQ
ncbi:MAG: inner membrane CreD family protein [Thiolinea sp.]